MARSTDTRRRPPELVARMQAARFTVQAEQLTHMRMPIFSHYELCEILDCARRIDRDDLVESAATALV